MPRDPRIRLIDPICRSARSSRCCRTSSPTSRSRRSGSSRARGCSIPSAPRRATASSTRPTSTGCAGSCASRRTTTCRSRSSRTGSTRSARFAPLPRMRARRRRPVNRRAGHRGARGRRRPSEPQARRTGCRRWRSTSARLRAPRRPAPAPGAAAPPCGPSGTAAVAPSAHTAGRRPAAPEPGFHDVADVIEAPAPRPAPPARRRPDVTALAGTPLRRGSAGHRHGAPAGPGRPPGGAGVGQPDRRGAGQASGLPARDVRELEGYGLSRATRSATPATTTATPWSSPARRPGSSQHGIEARHIRSYKVAVEREAGPVRADRPAPAQAAEPRRQAPRHADGRRADAAGRRHAQRAAAGGGCATTSAPG